MNFDDTASLEPESLLHAYASGIFPMADEDGVIRWYSADPRGVMPLDDAFHISRSLERRLKQSPESGGFDIRINTAFENTMRGCMAERSEGSWISEELIAAFCRLHQLGFAHSVEAWRGQRLVGGLYGIALRGAFFGESMFHRETDASKVVLVHVVKRLRERNYQLFDTQAVTPHLARFGCYEISSRTYLRRLQKALQVQCTFA